uniref:Transposase (Putative), gypsy type n=1 Tax=Tanacetum cinerariifolium TaxID=118510 RepID=A0A6L2LH94_TANCI|nr:transposase (putative), gypsy type [Tanacetum cinerariifolium]
MVFPTIMDWRTYALKDGMPAENTYSPEAVMILKTHRTSIQKQPEALLFLVGLSRRYYLGDEVYPTFLHDDDRDMDLFSLIRAPNPTKVKTGSRPRAAYEVPLSPLDFANENPSQPSTGPEDQEAAAPEVPSPKNVTTTRVAPESTRGGKFLAAIELGIGSTRPVLASQGAPVDVSDPDPLSFADPSSRPSADVAHIYRPEWGITNGCLLDAPEACQDLVDHIALPGYFSELRHLHNDDFLKQYNVNLARQVAIGSQLRLRFEREAKLLKKFVAQVSTLQEQVMGEENLKAAFEEFKQYEDNRVEQRCAEMDARLDAMSIDFDEELYPHMLTAIAGYRWVIGRGLRLAVMKCGESTELRQAFAYVVSAGIAKGMSEGLKYGVKHEKVKLDLEAIEAYDLEAKAKYIAALHALKKSKSDTGDDAPQWIYELRPSSSQLTIFVYLEARDPMDPWACKEEILLVDAIAANISHAEKKKKCRVVCRTHGVGSAHHARSDGVPVSVPTVAPQGLAILLADVATQTEISEDEASPQLLRSISLPA